MGDETVVRKRCFWAACVAAGALALAVLAGCAGEDGAAAASASPSPSPSPAVTPAPAVRPVTLELVGQTAFSDVPTDAPYREAAGYMAARGILGGLAQGTYSPETYADRGCVATALFRLSGAEEKPYTAAFSDVGPDAWYAPAVTWAVESGVLTGRTDGLFHPKDPVNRGELALMLYRYAQAQGMSTAAETDHLAEYWDGHRVPQETREALNWCADQGLLAPIAAREVHAGYKVTRAQLAQVLTALEAKGDLTAFLIHTRQCAGMLSRSQANHEALRSAIEATAKRYGAIGLQVAVLERGEVTDVFTYGRADKEDMSRDHKLRVASISKVVVAMNAMAMAEDGILDLDGSIGTYWDCQAVNRSYPNTPVSIRSVLSHTSSIPMYGDSTSRRYSSVRQRLAGGDFASLKPGDIRSWGYNNYGFGVLGMTLELAESRHYDEIAADNFFLPLDIDAGVVPGELDQPELIATLYRHSGEVGWSAASQRESRYKYAPGDYGNYFCGGLTISAIDLAKLYGVLAGDGSYEGQRLLSADCVEAMETPLGTPYGQLFEQCYPLRRQTDIYSRPSLYYHTGSAYGVYNLASYDPETGDGVIVLTTGASSAKDSHGIYAVCGAISQSVYETVAAEAPAAQS